MLGVEGGGFSAKCSGWGARGPRFLSSEGPMVPTRGAVGQPGAEGPERWRPAGTRHAPAGAGKANARPKTGAAQGSGLAMAYFPQGVAPQVSSALRRFTSVFGMGTGGAIAL